MELRSSVRPYAFDAATFKRLTDQVSSGALDPEANRLERAPTPLDVAPTDLGDAASAADRAQWTERGQAGLRRGCVAVVVLNGGMATRFGGGAKGTVAVVPGHPRSSFLNLKLAEAHRTGTLHGAPLPVVLMHSFATEAASVSHLRNTGWGGMPADDRLAFAQSIMPRVLPDGTPLQTLAEAADLDDDTIYAAPGHGDTLGRLQESGVLETLRARGVEHVLVSNVDNVGASVDPMVLGAHLEAVERGAKLSVEVVRRVDGDAGGCVATLPSGRAAIIEGFRLPAGTDLERYPHFNTNTLWCTLDVAAKDLPLQWFAVRKQIPWPRGPRAPEGQLEVVQFERLIGQATEFVDSAYLEVPRGERFLPIKTRSDLDASRETLAARARELGLLDT